MIVSITARCKAEAHASAALILDRGSTNKQTQLLVPCLCLGRRVRVKTSIGTARGLCRAETGWCSPGPSRVNDVPPKTEYLHAINSTTPANHHRKETALQSRQATYKEAKGREKPPASFPRSAARLL